MFIDSNQFTIYVSEVILWYISNLYTAICQLYLNKTGGKKQCGSGTRIDIKINGIELRLQK